MKTVYRNTYKMLVRPGTSDDFVCDEAILYKPLFVDVKPYDVLLDIGANIGSVSNLANKIEPNMNIYAYEPEEENFELLLLNTNHSDKIVRLNNAIGTGSIKTKLLCDNGSFKAKHSTVNREFRYGYKEQEVLQLDFMNEINNTNATLLKIDIEGGEYNLNFNCIPKQIKGIAIEIHLINNDHKSMLYLYRNLKEQFPYVLGEKVEDDLFYFKEVFVEPDSAFMAIFLRNEE